MGEHYRQSDCTATASVLFASSAEVEPLNSSLQLHETAKLPASAAQLA